ncbi:MAG: polymorphic toxin-type HINT domain-containing protein [Candidatus Dependentiae bacterium]|nr:polymorphic toxin-type HINT domain-containing protein [Candidatus Dependentiae bacterium]
MNKQFKLSILLSFLFFSTNLLPGFAAGTMVKTPFGYTSIEQLQSGNIVYSIAKSGDCCLSKVKKTTSYFLSRAILISVGDDAIIAAPQQKFYDPEKQIWCKAKHLQKSMPLLSGHKDIVTIDDIEFLDGEIEFFDVQLDNQHTFFIGTQDIVVHNFPPFFIGFSIAFGGGVSFEGLYCGICIAGWWLGTQLLKRGKSEKYNPTFSVGSSPAFAGGPDPEDEDEWTYGRYKESPKHHPNARNGIGKPPRKGQAALNKSIQIKNGPDRIAIEDNHFVVLRQTSNRVFHGYIIEEFKSLRRPEREALFYAKLVRHIANGGIIK